MCWSACSDGTPGGQSVSERFHMDWATVLVSSFGAIVARCDGRGSGFQGTNLLHRIQKKVGVLEEQDQMDAISKAGQRLLSSCQIYPDEGHFIHNEGTRQHLSQSLVNFFEECFRLPERLFDEELGSILLHHCLSLDLQYKKSPRSESDTLEYTDPLMCDMMDEPLSSGGNSRTCAV